MSEKNLTIESILGAALSAYLNNANITVYANAQNAAGDTMNEGKILIHGNIGYAMCGGKIYVQGNAGYLTRIHMKAYKEKIPVMIIGGYGNTIETKSLSTPSASHPKPPSPLHTVSHTRNP